METSENIKFGFEEDFKTLLQLRDKSTSLFELANNTLQAADQAFKKSQYFEHEILINKYTEIRKKEIEVVNQLLELLKIKLTQL